VSQSPPPSKPGRGLGRGLEALMGGHALDLEQPSPARPKSSLPIEWLKPQLHNPRKLFRFEDMDDLVQSIREKGILQPILVRPLEGENSYEIIAGERRWRAAQRAGLTDVPVFIREATDREALELALIENIQRSDLNPLEEAQGYQQLMDDFGYNQTAVAEVVGKSRSHIANMLRLLSLPDDVRKLVMDGQLTAGHARTLINHPDASLLARQMVADQVSVREAENLVRDHSDKTMSQSSASSAPASPDIQALEARLQEHLGLNVKLKARKNKGQLIIRYDDLDQFDALLKRLGL
jgi:ParB family chromosome partitioning protein